jgi:broad specificity phosphatase PhoE
VRLFVLARHANTTLNQERRVNGDPSVPVALTPEGRLQAQLLGHELAQLPLDLCVHTRFQRTRETAAEALQGRDIPLLEEAGLDDIDVGDLEGSSIDDYRAWKAEHTRADAFPGGESLDDAARRYADAFERLLARTDRTTLVVCHEIPIRYALNAAAGSDDLDGPEHAIPNATPYLFADDTLARAVDEMRRLAGR